MKLEYLYLDGYKGLKALSINFKEQPFPVSIDFLIGRNGSGKSSILEAVGLIFTMVMQEELPGFYFEIRYQMPDKTMIFIKPQRQDFLDEGGRRRRLYIEVEKDGVKEQLHAVPDEYLPDRIISYCSGANNSMEELLVSSPRDTLASELYDLSVTDQRDRDHEMVKEVLNYYEQLDANPRTLILDSITSRFVLPVLFAILPFDMQRRNIRYELRSYCERRAALMRRLYIDLVPVAFSFRVRDEMLKRASDTPQMNIFMRLLEHTQSDDDCLNDYILERSSADQVDDEGALSSETVVTFMYTLFDQEDEQSYYHPKLQKYFDGNPFILLSALLTAYREGVIGDVCFTFRDGGESGLYETEALSDGELMWLVRTGLVLLAQNHCGSNTLFLLDEPDVHFNDDWNQDFIKVLYELSRETQHEFIIATHSTLILTDAMYGQLYLFDRGPGKRTEVSDVNYSTFAAGRDQISRQIFGAEPIGDFAAESVERMMQEKDLESMKENIAKLGPGYSRFRMYEQLYTLLDEMKNRG